MGIIEKQGLQGTILTYAGVLIGFVTAGILFPLLFSQEEIGVMDVLNAWSIILATLATLGINNVSNRLFPWFRNEKNHHNGYLGILFFVLGSGLLLSTGVYYLIRPYILKKALETGDLLPQFIDLIIPLTAFSALFLILDIFYAVLYRSVKGIFHKEFLQRIFILLAIIAFVVFVLDFPLFVYLYVAAICLPGVTLLFSLIREGKLVIHINRSILNKPLVVNMLSVAFFGVIVSFSNILIQKIDILMIQHFMDTKAVGTYSRVFFYGTLVAVPLRVLAKISAVVTAQAWKDNKLDTIREIYQKSTINQLLIASLVFVGLWGNIENILHIIGEDYAEGKWVVFYIGLSNLFLMAAGVSGAIISTSKEYRVLTLFVGLFGALVIVSNLVFIPKYGLYGAALASAISALLYSLLRYFFLLGKYKMQPYSYKHLLIILTAAGSFGLNLLIPDLYNPESHWLSISLDVLVRSAVMTISFILIARILNLSVDLTKWMGKFINKLGGS